MWVKVFKWLFFSVALSLLPFAWSISGLLFHNHPLHGLADLAPSWERGELLLVSVTLVAAGIGDVVGSDLSRLRVFKIIVIGSSLLFLLWVVHSYSDISSCIVQHRDYDHEAVKRLSPWLLFFSIIDGLACILLSKEA